MTYENYFPRGIASESAFCNRIAERKKLLNNIETGQHTLLISPRRYGKTSLVNYVVKDSNLPVGDADLFVAVDARHIEQRILAGIKMAMHTLYSSTEQLLRSLRDYFQTINNQWIIGTQGISLVMTPGSKESDPATNIMEALLALEHLLSKKQKRGVIFLDEMQEIGVVAEGQGIEGAIRHVAQKSKYLVFIFSGSNRHLLSHMFYDKARPLYKLCDRINLERISQIDYTNHLNLLSKKKWKTDLPSESIKKIFELTECHPYYMNTLCLRLWESNVKTTPTVTDIIKTWLDIAKEERLEIARELSSLSLGQKKILISIAAGFSTQLTGKAFLNRVNMTGSSVSSLLQSLEQKDYVEKQDKEYVFIDPLVKTTLNLYFGEE